MINLLIIIIHAHTPKIEHRLLTKSMQISTSLKRRMINLKGKIKSLRKVIYHHFYYILEINKFDENLEDILAKAYFETIIKD